MGVNALSAAPDTEHEQPTPPCVLEQVGLTSQENLVGENHLHDRGVVDAANRKRLRATGIGLDRWRNRHCPNRAGILQNMCEKEYWERNRPWQRVSAICSTKWRRMNDALPAASCGNGENPVQLVAKTQRFADMSDVITRVQKRRMQSRR